MSKISILPLVNLRKKKIVNHNPVKDRHNNISQMYRHLCHAIIIEPFIQAVKHPIDTRAANINLLQSRCAESGDFALQRTAGRRRVARLGHSRTNRNRTRAGRQDLFNVVRRYPAYRNAADARAG